MTIPTLHWLSIVATIQSLLLLSQARPHPYWHHARDGGNQTAQSALLAQASQLASANATYPNDAISQVLSLANRDFNRVWRTSATAPMPVASSSATVAVSSIPTNLPSAAAANVSSVASIPTASVSAAASSSALPPSSIASDSQILTPLSTPTPLLSAFLPRKRALSASSSHPSASSSATSSNQPLGTIIPTGWSSSIDNASSTAASFSATGSTSETGSAATITPAPIKTKNRHGYHNHNDREDYEDSSSGDTTSSEPAYTATLGEYDPFSGGPGPVDLSQSGDNLAI